MISYTSAQKSVIATFAGDERGLSTVEYVIILVLIAAAAIGTWQTFGDTIKQKLSDSNAAIRDMNGNGNGNGTPGSNQNQGASRPTPDNGGQSAPAAPAVRRAAGKVDD
jgi:Flp pilus assembly pilin Flp